MDSAKPVSASSPAIAGHTDLSGRTLGDYQIIRHLGKGGMGHVYLAEQISLKRKVALKFLRTELASNPQAMERFQAEAMAIARVTHANIVQVFAIGEVEDLPFIALEYIEGRTLRDFVEKKGPPDLFLSLSIMRQGASALLRAAELGIIHRDIKPDNILLTRKGEVKITDFGLARVLDGAGPAVHLTQSGVVMGTPVYMSPEQVEGKPLDTRSDIYSFGITSYHMLTGHPPFHGATAIEVALQHLQAEAKPLASLRPDLPEALGSIVHKMMAKDPARRYQNSRDLLRDVIRLRDSLSTTGTDATRADFGGPAPSVELVPLSDGATATGSVAPPATVFGWKRRHWFPLAVAGSLVLAACLGAVVALARRPPAHAQLAANKTPPDSFADSKPPDPLAAKRLREEGLLAAVEPFLTPPQVTKPEKFGAGFELCMQLTLLYMEEHRLEEGKRFFVRLEGITAVPAYHHLGGVARAVALALQNKPRESNGLLRDLAAANALRNLAGKRLENAEGKRNPGPEMRMWVNPSFRYWIAEALRYNQRNGIDDAEVPRPFLGFRERAEAGARTKKEQ